MAAIYGTSATKRQLIDLQRAQDNAIRIFYTNGNCNNLNAIYEKHNLLNVKQIISYDLAVLIYKWKHSLLKLIGPLQTRTAKIF